MSQPSQDLVLASPQSNLGGLITTFRNELWSTNSLGPEVSLAARTLPPNPVHGEAVSTFVSELIPQDPYGPQLSAYIADLRSPPITDDLLI